MFYKTYLTTIYAIVTISMPSASQNEEAKAAIYMRNLNEKNARIYKRFTIAEWEYETNITDFNIKNKISVESEAAKEIKKDWLKTIQFNWRSFRDPNLRRQFEFLSILGTPALSDEKFKRLSNTVADMVSIYSTTKLCDYNNSSKCDLDLERDIMNIFTTSRDPEELKYYWLQWRNAIGPKVKDKYEEYVKLSNEAATLNNFTDNTEFWLLDFESHDIQDEFQRLWEQVKPLYLQIHAYVRYRLRETYGDVVSESGPMPVHLLGNRWTRVIDFTLPYPDVQNPNITHELVKQGYTPMKMFKTADEFFVSLNLTAMPETFWSKSILEKPSDGRELVCPASAWDFYDKDVRIKQCTQVTEDDFYTVHHEMGHIEYFLQYSNQPTVYRNGANSGFHEAIGDVIALSVASTKHLQKIGLLDNNSLDDRVLLNNLYKIGLEKIVLLPFCYLMDIWRWDVFSNKISKDHWNCKLWELRHEYQGIEPPVDRSERDFDPAGEYHILANVPYIRYFVSFIIQFQFHEALCSKAGKYDANDPNKPLHNCDIYKNKEAGNLLGKMLQMGASKPWPDAMEVLTGQRNMDASALLEYFKPLQTWLEEENKKNGAFVGWQSTERICSSSRNNEEEETYDDKYEYDNTC